MRCDPERTRRRSTPAKGRRDDTRAVPDHRHVKGRRPRTPPLGSPPSPIEKRGTLHRGCATQPLRSTARGRARSSTKAQAPPKAARAHDRRVDAARRRRHQGSRPGPTARQTHAASHPLPSRGPGPARRAHARLHARARRARPQPTREGNEGPVGETMPNGCEWNDTVNDPSAGSPTETLLRLLLPLNDKVWTTSRGISFGEPTSLPQSKGLTGSFNR